MQFLVQCMSTMFCFSLTWNWTKKFGNGKSASLDPQLTNQQTDKRLYVIYLFIYLFFKKHSTSENNFERQNDQMFPIPVVIVMKCFWLHVCFVSVFRQIGIKGFYTIGHMMAQALTLTEVLCRWPLSALLVKPCWNHRGLWVKEKMTLGYCHKNSFVLFSFEKA